MKNKIAAALCAVLSVSAVLGCSVMASENSEGKHINAALYWFGSTLDPATDYDGWTLCRIGAGETLVTINENLEIEGQLADEWEMVDENTWKFHIRDGVTFQNGNPVTGEAVKNSIQRALDAQERSYTSTYISAIEADGQTVTFTTDQPNASFLNAISEPLFIIVDTTADTDPATQPVGTGPFIVTDFTPDEEIQLVKYDDYWNGASDVDTLTVKNISDDSTRAMALQSGDMDIVQRISSADLPLFTDNEDYVVVDTAGIRTRTLYFNYENEVLQDINVRKAFISALDFEALATVLGNDVEVAGAPFPISIYGYDEVEIQSYDPEAAVSYLEAAGYTDSDGDGYVDKDGEKLTLGLTYDISTMTSVNEAIQNMEKQIGIDVQLNLVETVDEIEANGDFDLMQKNTQYLSTGDPSWMLSAIYQTGSNTNYYHYSNEELDEVISKLTSCFDQDEKTSLVKEAQEILLEDAAHVYLMSQSNIVAANSKVSGITAYPIDYYFVTNTLTISE
ncbi:MAG: ABC transporter substrate-binding protein [Lachnospiraceae bacterium]|nr:ABC transporter substrate-binding protein [Lachnospiraceae bacterium]